MRTDVLNLITMSGVAALGAVVSVADDHAVGLCRSCFEGLIM